MINTSSPTTPKLNAVWKALPKGSNNAAILSSISLGILIMLDSGMQIYSENAPETLTPIPFVFRQIYPFPARQLRQ